jgi:ABC-type uncharacterized transport system permease subunit
MNNNFSERGQILLVVMILLAIIVLGGCLVIRNGSDPFTSFWAGFSHLIQYSESVK